MRDDVWELLFSVTVFSRKLIAMTLRIGDRGPISAGIALPLYTNLLRFPLWGEHEFEHQQCTSWRLWQIMWHHGSDGELAQVMQRHD
jgi:hypothetical protein